MSEIISENQKGISPVNRIDTTYRKIAYLDTETAGKTLVFIHGNSSCKEVFTNQINSDLARSFRIVALDLPGHGDSDDAIDPASTYTIGHYARMLKEIIDHLSIEKPVLVGWSLGGHVAIEAIAQNPAAYAGLVMMGTPPVGPGIDNMYQAFIPSEHMGMTAQVKFSAEEASYYAAATLGGEEFVTDKLLEGVIRTDGRARESMLTDWSDPTADGHSQAEIMASWPGSVCVFHGINDSFVSLDYLRQLQWNNLWREEIQVLENIGHAPFLENPQVFNTQLKQYLS